MCTIFSDILKHNYLYIYTCINIFPDIYYTILHLPCPAAYLSYPESSVESGASTACDGPVRCAV